MEAVRALQLSTGTHFSAYSRCSLMKGPLEEEKLHRFHERGELSVPETAPQNVGEPKWEKRL